MNIMREMRVQSVFQIMSKTIYPRMMIKPIALILLITASVTSLQVKAETSESNNKYGVGFALGMPAIGYSFKAVLTEKYTISALYGDGYQAQINFTGKSSAGGYYLLGAGRDEHVGLIRSGFGYVWNKGNFSFNAELALNIPFYRTEVDGFSETIQVIEYAFPIGFGIHYHF